MFPFYTLWIRQKTEVFFSRWVWNGNIGQKWVWKIDVYPIYKGEILLTAEAALQMCFFYKIKFWKYATNLQENTHAEMWFQ